MRKTRSLGYLLDRYYILTGSLYFISQVFIILSAQTNGSVVTALGVLLGDAVLTPVVTIVLKINTSRVRYMLFLMAMVLVIPSSALITTYGKSVSITGPLGLAYFIGIIISLSTFFILLNRLVERKGSMSAISGTFLWPGIISLFFGLYLLGGQHPHISLAVPFVSLFLAGITSMGFSYTLFFASVKKAGFAVTGLLQSMIPIFTTVLVVIFERTNITLLDLVLIFTTIIGAVLAMLSISQPGEIVSGSPSDYST